MMFSMAAPTFDIGTGASGVKWGQCRPDARRVVFIFQPLIAVDRFW